jgi:hypothetical protein
MRGSWHGASSFCLEIQLQPGVRLVLQSGCVTAHVPRNPSFHLLLVSSFNLPGLISSTPLSKLSPRRLSPLAQSPEDVSSWEQFLLDMQTSHDVKRVSSLDSATSVTEVQRFMTLTVRDLSLSAL